eukprot:403331390
MNSDLAGKIPFKYHPLNLPPGQNSSDAAISDHIIKRDTLKILSYNLYMRPPPVKTNESDFKDARLEEFVHHFEDYDVICNQEVFTTLNSRKQKLITYAHRAGFMYHCISDPPPFFSGYATDGGLVILSRFPIIEHEFSPYPYGVLSDSLSYKGVLYAKISVGENRIMHVFNTHTQASYYGTDLANFLASFEVRYMQLRCARKFVEQKTQNAHENDLILFVGDFNANGQKDNAKAKAFREQVKHRPGFDELLDEMENEYKSMIEILSGHGEDQIIDCAKIANNGESPITYADIDTDFQGNVVPRETILTDAEDLKTTQSLDYVFEIKRKHLQQTQKKQSPVKSSKNGQESKAKEGNGKNGSEQKLEVLVKETVVEKFFVEGHKFTQLSDHYGISTQIQII